MSTDPAGVGLIACGALATHAGLLARAHGWDLSVYPLNPLLHNTPTAIAAAVDACADEVSGRHTQLVLGYADCGTYGALDEVCRRRGIARLPGLHCYDVYAAGSLDLSATLAQEPGTYLFTDFLVRSFSRTVVQELGLDRFPELREDYFRHYRQVLWLVQTDDPQERARLRALAQAAADRLELPLMEAHVGLSGLEAALRAILDDGAIEGAEASARQDG